LRKILITGSGGFLGSSLTDYLTRKKYHTVGISIHPKKSNFNQICGDVKTISNIPRDISCIVHYAALTDVDYCQNNPKDCFATNVMGTQNMLELARKHDAKLVFASTSQVFGIPKKLPIAENAELHPLSIYAASKACGEILCETYSKSYGLNVVIIRSFSIYGPQSPPHLVTTNIITQTLKKNKIKIGNLSPKRDFLYITDLVSAFELLINKNLKGCSKYNVGSGKSISINDLCRKIIKISKKKILFESDKKLFRKSEIPDLFCDITKIKKLDWKPKITIDEGLTHTIDWFKNEFKK